MKHSTLNPNSPKAKIAALAVQVAELTALTTKQGQQIADLTRSVQALKQKK